MIQIIDVKDGHNINKFNEAAKQAHEHPDTHGLLIKVYANWCGHCRNMTHDWNRLIKELKQNSLLSIYGLVTIILLYIFKTIDIPHIRWFIHSCVITKNFTIHLFIIFISALIFWTIIDSIKVVFSITKSFEFTREANHPRK